MNHEADFEFSEIRQTIIPGFSSLFDGLISADAQGREAVKQQLKEVTKILWEAKTLTSFYLGVQKVISLPNAANETEMKSNLLSLDSAIKEIPLADRREAVELLSFYYERQIWPKFVNIIS